MIVQFLAECYGFQAGQVVEFPYDEAVYVIESGYAQAYDPENEPEFEAPDVELDVELDVEEETDLEDEAPEDEDE